ncbi:hypothetical protein ACFQFC_32775 [Amorphoplanes digitatis]|uniref:Ribulose 1,5-bisphosphate carboxylase large subunit n=1 Tax=Actinoplanes digitatis TaxID=1868 RepID=A0A7W7HU90_9ACTN|nr:hypothetical protein [Actinoplanes digitatis]MBB4760933.1 hypothetical protein [Actinoplanes digitatis]
MALLPSPAALVELSRYAIGQVVETAASVATIPVRALSLLGQTELLVSRITVLAERAEGLIDRVDDVLDRVDGVVDGAEEALTDTKVIMAGAALAVDEAGVLMPRAAQLLESVSATTDGAAAILTEAGAVAGAASVVVRQAEATSAEAHELLDAYGPTLRRAAPLAQRFVEELTPEEITAAIRMIDELPRLREHLSDDVMPLLGTLDKVGPDLHALLDVVRDLRMAIVGIPGLKMLRRRGEEQVAEDEANDRP